jgi:hypothetical protein
MMTKEDRVHALKHFGYTEREAEFLSLAALYSGYFLRRQYCNFLGVSSGRPDDLLIRKVLQRGHAREFSTSKRTFLYHIYSRPLYNAIGEFNNRHRRARPPFSIKVKLMAFDFVLSNLCHQFLATEEEKIAYFCQDRGISLQKLPTKAYQTDRSPSTTLRRFVDKFPIFIRSDQDISPPMVSFSYIDEGIISTPGFETYLKRYSQLFKAIGQFEVHFVSTQKSRIQAATAIFRRLIGGAGATYDSFQEQLLTYFRLENFFRTSQLNKLNSTTYDELKYLRSLFKTHEYEELFKAWKQQGEGYLKSLLSPEQLRAGANRPRLILSQLDQNYNFL